MGCSQSTGGHACSCLPSNSVARRGSCPTAGACRTPLRRRGTTAGNTCRRSFQQNSQSETTIAPASLMKKAEYPLDLPHGPEPAHLSPELETPRRTIRQSLGLRLSSRKLAFLHFLRSPSGEETVPSSRDGSPEAEHEELQSASGPKAGGDDISVCLHDASAFFKAFNCPARASLNGSQKDKESVAGEGEPADEPTCEEMRAVWLVMKANSANEVEQKIEWFHRLEWLLVKLDPMESNHPTRRALLEARVLELCLDCLRENSEDPSMCVSALAILVHMSLNDETSSQLASTNSIEEIAGLLKKYYARCVEHYRAQKVYDGQSRQSGDSNEDQADRQMSKDAPDDCAGHGAQSGQKQNGGCTESVGTENKGQQTVKENEPSAREDSADSLVMATELITLVWRLIFATSLDGDEYAQKWVKAGAAEPAMESVASSLDIFCSATYVCWVFGALRFLSLDNDDLCEDFVQHRHLFSWTLEKMQLHHEEPLVLENGFAVLANYQRNHPAHASILSKLPEVWTKSLSWLSSDSMLRVPDVIYQGLYTMGLACSYCPSACTDLRDAGGVEFANRVASFYGSQLNQQGAREDSWPACDKYANVLQFAEGLLRLMAPVTPAETGIAPEETIREDNEREAGEDDDSEKEDLGTVRSEADGEESSRSSSRDKAAVRSLHDPTCVPKSPTQEPESPASLPGGHLEAPDTAVSEGRGSFSAPPIEKGAAHQSEALASNSGSILVFPSEGAGSGTPQLPSLPASEGGDASYQEAFGTQEDARIRSGNTDAAVTVEHLLPAPALNIGHTAKSLTDYNESVDCMSNSVPGGSATEADTDGGI
ncbi:hypothetical protein CSUI_004548 [Cystoisospora suis]|uniref:Uncharacterized protein n=1 Tax=Cystoisospora suis TaxID=483139 RepID=A0A2C6KYC1_9APIC|nr:hypothetical protein CSUI_004548 [Cystoisospora suis]